MESIRDSQHPTPGYWCGAHNGSPYLGAGVYWQPNDSTAGRGDILDCRTDADFRVGYCSDQAQIEERTGQRPAVLLADGGHAKAEDIAATRRMGVDVIVPPAETAKTIEKLKAEGSDPEVVRCWGIINNNDVRMPAGRSARSRMTTRSPAGATTGTAR